MVNTPIRLRFVGLALASLVLSLAACPGGVVQDPDCEGSSCPIDSGPGGRCGDGQKTGNEACDDGNTKGGDGCAANCGAVEPGYACEASGIACVWAGLCGDGKVEFDEKCDDRNSTGGDGCSADCRTVEDGWNCPLSGGRCQAARCGDLIIAGDEECEDGNSAKGDGCSEVCRLEAGYKCDNIGKPCTKTVCGDKVREGTEQCDDGNHDMGDGCSPLCVREPNCNREGICQAVCGDGVILPGTNEECDDGNTRSNDGCSAECKYEEGFACDVIKSTPPDKLELPFVFRDFRGWNHAADSSLGLPKGHIDFENGNNSEKGILGPLYSLLGSDGKPVYAKTGNGDSATTHGKAAFDQWYRDVDPEENVNKTVVKTLPLLKKSDGAYQLDDSEFFELDNDGWVKLGSNYERTTNGHNFSFTSEVRYWFEYKETEVLSFRGDDDVWVFINGRLALDLGGVHGPESGTITLKNVAGPDKLNLVKGRIYEAVVFQAERHTTGSNYQLTLSNFNTTRTECRATCGNGVIDKGEECDDGVNTGGYGKCARGCVWGPRCGDKSVQKDQGETCDDGNTTSGDGCSSICKLELN
jgi:fibro-slime domain-containing protein